ANLARLVTGRITGEIEEIELILHGDSIHQRARLPRSGEGQGRIEVIFIAVWPRTAVVFGDANFAPVVCIGAIGVTEAVIGSIMGSGAVIVDKARASGMVERKITLRQFVVAEFNRSHALIRANLRQSPASRVGALIVALPIKE